MKFEKLTIENFNDVKEILGQKYSNSEASLASMYIWQHYYDTRFCIEDGILYSIYKMPNQPYKAFMPYGEGRNSSEVIGKLASYFKTELNTPLTISLATEDFLDYIKNSDSYKIKYSEKESSFDYVYNVDDLINLSGKKYHTKKNHFNTFTNKYDCKYVRYDKSYYDECVNFCSEVIKMRTGDNTAIYDSEMKSIYKAFDNYKVLGLICSMIIVDNKIVALSVGEKLTSDYALIHIEKAAYEYRDAYPVINKLTLENEFSDLKYVNREEDLGIEGLRKAKRSYHPCKMIKKFNIEFID